MDSRGDGQYGSFSKDATVYADIKHMAQESAVFQEANKLVAKGLDWQEGGKRTLNKDKERALIESAALVLKYPQLSMVPMFPAFYRYLRTEELGGALTRGGETLLVGSGTTLFEALAFAVEQPIQYDVERTFADFSTNINTLHARRRAISDDPSAADAVPLLPHRILAYEPDKRQTAQFNDANKIFNTNTAIVNGGVKDIFKFPSRKFKNVSLNRVDPVVFDPQLLPALMNFVEPDGSFIMTIGTGRTLDELLSRKAFLEQVTSQLLDSGFTVASKLPRLLEKEKRRQFGPEMVGAVIGKRVLK